MPLSTLIQQPRILVQQNKEWGELLGFETRNRFDLLSEEGELLGRAAEEGGGLGTVLLRQFLGRCRKATVHLFETDGSEMARVEKPFRWYFHRVELHEDGRVIGAIQRRFSILHRLFAIEDDQGRELLTIKSPFFRIWTFKLQMGELEVGRISKKWGGFLKEAFMDADTFGVEFSEPGLDDEVKKLLVAATFLIDFTCFENNQGRGGGISFLGDG